MSERTLFGDYQQMQAEILALRHQIQAEVTKRQQLHTQIMALQDQLQSTFHERWPPLQTRIFGPSEEELFEAEKSAVWNQLRDNIVKHAKRKAINTVLRAIFTGNPLDIDSPTNAAEVRTLLLKKRESSMGTKLAEFIENDTVKTFFIQGWEELQSEIV